MGGGTHSVRTSELEPRIASYKGDDGRLVLPLIHFVLHKLLPGQRMSKISLN